MQSALTPPKRWHLVTSSPSAFPVRPSPWDCVRAPCHTVAVRRVVQTLSIARREKSAGHLGSERHLLRDLHKVPRPQGKRRDARAALRPSHWSPPVSAAAVPPPSRWRATPSECALLRAAHAAPQLSETSLSSAHTALTPTFRPSLTAHTSRSGASHAPHLYPSPKQRSEVQAEARTKLVRAIQRWRFGSRNNEWVSLIFFSR